MVIVTLNQVTRRACDLGPRLWKRYMKNRKSAPLNTLLRKAMTIKRASTRCMVVEHLVGYAGPRRKEQGKDALMRVLRTPLTANQAKYAARLFAWRNTDKYSVAVFMADVGATKELVEFLAPPPPPPPAVYNYNAEF